jgi:hypothetical protein
VQDYSSGIPDKTCFAKLLSRKIPVNCFDYLVGAGVGGSLVDLAVVIAVV